MAEKVHDRGGRRNNKAEKNVKYQLEDHKPGDMITCHSLEEEGEIWQDAATGV